MGQVEDAGSELGGLDCCPIPALVPGTALGPPGPDGLFPPNWWGVLCLSVSGPEEAVPYRQGLGE